MPAALSTYFPGNSEETRSVDLASRTDSKDKGLYTESFHSASWIFRGDDCSPDNSPRCLSKRTRSVASKWVNMTILSDTLSESDPPNK